MLTHFFRRKELMKGSVLNIDTGVARMRVE
jgi:hypothetical protein